MGGGRKSHYYLLLPQDGRLLLKNSGGFRQKKYALFQAAIFQKRFHRFFRGRDSMKVNKEIAVFSFSSNHKKL